MQVRKNPTEWAKPRGNRGLFCRDCNRFGEHTAWSVSRCSSFASSLSLFIKCIDRKSVGISSSNEESINALPSVSAVHLLFYRRRRRPSPFLNHCRHMVRPAVRRSLQQRPSRRPFLCFSIFRERERERERDGTKTAIQHEAPFVQPDITRGGPSGAEAAIQARPILLPMQK